MNLKLRSFIFTILATNVCYATESVSMADISKLYTESQSVLAEAQQIKSIERLLRTLSRADVALQAAREKMRDHTASNGAEERMKSRITYSLMADVEFLRELKADLGLAEADSLESYRALRLSLLQNPSQKQQVIKMDLQILKTVAMRPSVKSHITTR